MPRLAWALGLGALLLFILAGSEYLGYVTAAMLSGWTPQAVAVAGVLFAVAGAAVYHREGEGWD